MRRPKTVSISWRTTPEAKEALAAIAELDQRSMSREIEWLVQERLKKLGELSLKDQTGTAQHKKRSISGAKSANE